jgi:hypothetical protein
MYLLHMVPFFPPCAGHHIAESKTLVEFWLDLLHVRIPESTIVVSAISPKFIFDDFYPQI